MGKREVELACKRENPDRKEGEFDYGCACYESALKAYNSLQEDGHSGLSIRITQNILNRLIDYKPLTPIEDTDDIWDRTKYLDEPDCEAYRCNRMVSLSKYVYKDGIVKYRDQDYVEVYDTDDREHSWKNGFISNLIHEMFPITMPYVSSEEPFKVYIRTFTAYPQPSLMCRVGYDTIHILYGTKPDGKNFAIDRYFKEHDDGIIEIDYDEYIDRYEESEKLKKRPKGE